MVIFASLSVGGCQAGFLYQDPDLITWKYADLKIIDPVDAVKPEQDLIAVYWRQIGDTFQIRLDFLELNTLPENDIYIPVDIVPYSNIQSERITRVPVNALGMDWDYLIKITHTGKVSILDSHYSVINNPEIFIYFDEPQDCIVVDLIHNPIPIYNGRTELQVLVVESNDKVVIDSTPFFHVDAPSPETAKILFLFWDGISSITPAQALRSWSGAHAGPMSSRHGLEYLFNNAEQAKATIFMVDFLSPDIISTLDYMQKFTWIKFLVDKNIIGNIDNDSNKISDLLFSDENNIIMFGSNDYAHYTDNLTKCVLVASSNLQRAGIDTFTLPCKELLVFNALQQPSTPLVLGGDFSTSILGDPAISSEVFRYIAYHPWIQVLTRYDEPVSDFASREAIFSSRIIKGADKDPAEVAQIKSKLSEAIDRAPNNELFYLAKNIFDTLTKPGAPDVYSLRSSYIGQLGFILEAAQWAAAPGVIQTCTNDLDYDGADECVLADENLFAVIEPEGGYIPFLFSMDAQGTHQLIGPTWEFVVGLSDPSSWNTSLGIRGDPSQLLGAFQDSFTDWKDYNAEISDGKIVLSDSLGTSSKAFSISTDKIQVDITNSQGIETAQIPVVIDPWQRYSPGWGKLYNGIKENNSYRWGITGGITLQITSSAPINAYAFNDTYAMMSRPEDPNYDYSPGHYLPFPMAVVNIKNANEYSVVLKIISNP